MISGKARPDPDRFIRVNARSGFLAARTTKLGLRADGTLSSFNATTEGQGGEVLSALIGVASKVASFGFGAPLPAMQQVGLGRDTNRTPPPLTCNEGTAERVARMHDLETDLESLRSQIANGGEAEGASRALTQLTAELADVVGELTLETNVAQPFNPDRSSFTGTQSESRVIARVNYSDWFTEDRDLPEEIQELERGLQAAGVSGRFGYLATLAPDRAIFDALSGDGREFPGRAESTSHLFYRRPVPANIVVTVCSAAAQGGTCTLATGPTAISNRATVALPQLSGPIRSRSAAVASSGRNLPARHSMNRVRR